MKTGLIFLVVTLALTIAGEPLMRADNPKTKKCPFGCGKRTTKVYDLAASNVTGDQVRGPATIVANNLNFLRYDYKFNVAVTFSSAPDLFGKLQSVIAAPAPAPTSTPKAALQEAPPQAKDADAAKAWQDAQTAIANATSLIRAATGSGTATPCSRSDARVTVPPTTPGLDMTNETARQSNCLDLLVTINSDATGKVKAAGKALVDLLQRNFVTPDVLDGYMADALKPESTFMAGIGASWPGFDAVASVKQSALAWKAELADRSSKFNAGLVPVAGALTAAKTALVNALPGLSAPEKKASKEQIKSDTDILMKEADLVSQILRDLTSTNDTLARMTAENQRVLGVIPDLEASSPKYADFEAAQTALVGWKTRMTDLHSRWTNYKGGRGDNPFSLSAPPPVTDCGFTFATTKTIAVTLSRVDRMPGATAAAPETVLSVSVICTTPFTVSAGVAFSTIPKHQFAIQASAPTPPATATVNKFVVTDNSNFHPLLIGMIHARVCEFNETIALHASFGMAGNFQSSNAGGSSAEFLIGPSLSLFRTMFFTPGLHLGSKASLGAGFNVGDVVPANITQPPIQTAYTPGFGFAITFTKP